MHTIPRQGIGAVSLVSEKDRNSLWEVVLMMNTGRDWSTAANIMMSAYASEAVSSKCTWSKPRVSGFGFVVCGSRFRVKG